MDARSEEEAKKREEMNASCRKLLDDVSVRMDGIVGQATQTGQENEAYVLAA
jgi:hypothetical protein